MHLSSGRSQFFRLDAVTFVLLFACCFHFFFRSSFFVCNASGGRPEGTDPMDSSFFLFGLSHIARSGNTKPGAARSRPKGSKKRGKTNGRVQDRIEDTPLLAGSRQRPESALHFRRKQSRFVIRRTPSRHRSHCPVSRPFDPHLFLSCVFLVSISFTPFPSLVLHAYSLYPPLGTDHFSVTSGKSWAGWASLLFFPPLKDARPLFFF